MNANSDDMRRLYCGIPSTWIVPMGDEIGFGCHVWILRPSLSKFLEQHASWWCVCVSVSLYAFVCEMIRIILLAIAMLFWPNNNSVNNAALYSHGKLCLDHNWEFMTQAPLSWDDICSHTCKNVHASIAFTYINQFRRNDMNHLALTPKVNAK